ncbi:MAG: hypothetical protein JWQ02_44 [Capsulimonas sp.]|nr:hypothetical protein [Capsulimonas sp.]
MRQVRSRRSGSGKPRKRSAPSNPLAGFWRSFAMVSILATAVPMTVYILIARSHPGFLPGLLYVTATVYGITNVMVMWEAVSALRAVPKPPADLSDPPMCSAIIAAYLPNEQHIIEQTIDHMLTTIDLPADRFEVILAYNRPKELPVEDRLRELAARDPRLKVLCVVDSRSKAANVNAALTVARGEILGIYDADHWPAADCFRRAWRWISSGYDVVQGRCAIRNHDENVLTRSIAVEFDIMYSVSHQGRSRISRSGIFGGSNGYWRAETLRSVQLDPQMLTEDIDSTVRAIQRGAKFIHDRDIVSVELAPTRLSHWLIQRKRWSQGWLEVTLKHHRGMMASPHLTIHQKILWFYLLPWREWFPVLSTQFFPMLFASWIVGQHLHWFATPYLRAAATLNLLCSLFVLLIAFVTATRLGRKGHAPWYIVHGVFGLVYSTLKTTVTLVAQYCHLIRDREWVTTPREDPPPAPTAAPADRISSFSS